MKNNTIIYEGIEYTKPSVYLLQESGIGVMEYGSRTAYDSFDSSENYAVSYLNDYLNTDTQQYNGQSLQGSIRDLNSVQSSELLDSLAWVHHHHSVLELANLSFLVKGISRGVLVEFSRHRHQSLTVRSTRYTGSGILNAFVSADSFTTFAKFGLALDMFVTTEEFYNIIELRAIYDKLGYQRDTLGNKAFIELSLSKDARTNGALELSTPQERFDALQASKAKRNALDPFKHIVTDNFKVDLVFNMNLRAMKNFLDLRANSAAFFQIIWMAEAIIAAIPDKYLRLIRKDRKDKK